MTEPKIVYRYHPSTGEYQGPDFAYLSPADEGEVWLAPPNSTEVEPPAPVANKAAVWEHDEESEWTLVDDFRNRMIYKKTDASKAHFLDLGPVPGEYTIEAPAEGIAKPFWDEEEGEWIETPYVAPPLTWDDIRMKRDGLLYSCDWTQLSDSPLSAPQKAAWAAYRAELRNVPDDFATPEDVEWPNPPA